MEADQQISDQPPVTEAQADGGLAEDPTHEEVPGPFDREPMEMAPLDATPEADPTPPGKVGTVPMTQEDHDNLTGGA